VSSSEDLRDEVGSLERSNDEVGRVTRAVTKSRSQSCPAVLLAMHRRTTRTAVPPRLTAAGRAQPAERPHVQHDAADDVCRAE
jgi:hypothetical protein